MSINVYTQAQQGIGAFDGGKITEQKPIGFPGEGSAVKRVGPLFYWAWAHAKEEGFIPPHPHHAFEIMTYVVKGKAEHGDSLGTRSVVGPGGAQVMQTGSGVYHQEGFIGPDMEGFQIWFEPYLNESVKMEPSYNQYEHEEFPLVNGDGYSVKTIIGSGAPIELVADAQAWDIEVKPGAAYRRSVEAGRSLAVLAIRGNGALDDTPVHHRDFAVYNAETSAEVSLQAVGDENLRVIVIEVPTTVDYPLYQKR